jgi:hypothetical protein
LTTPCGTTRPIRRNRDRLLEADISREFLARIVEHPEVSPLLSDEHFTVDGTLINAWASLKSFVPKAAETLVAPGQDGTPQTAALPSAAVDACAPEPGVSEPAPLPASAQSAIDDTVGDVVVPTAPLSGVAAPIEVATAEVATATSNVALLARFARADIWHAI